MTNSLELQKNPSLIYTKEHINALIEDRNYDEVMDVVRTMYAGVDSDRTALVSMLVAIGQMNPAPSTIRNHDSNSEAAQRQKILKFILARMNGEPESEATLDEMSQTEPTAHDLDTAALQLFHLPVRKTDHPVQTQIIPPQQSLAHTLAALSTLETLTKEAEDVDAPASLMIHLLGSFEVYVNHQPVTDWSNRKGKLLFKYLVTNREQRVPKEVLMDTFWPDSDPDAARNNLNVTIYALRRDLHQHDADFSHILFEDDSYFLNPDMLVWVDSEKFLEHAQQGQQLEQAGDIFEAIKAYRAASTLYRGAFLGDAGYEEWLELQRQYLQNTYLQVLDRLCHFYFEQKDYAACINACNEIISVDSCREDAHRRLMLCFEQQGHPYLALRQFQLCKEFLKRELDIEPGEETTELYERIRSQRA